jgi:hypothetical protein
MRCNRQIRRFKTETVEYLKTRRKLLAVEHVILSKDSEGASYPIRRMAKGIQDFGLVFRQNNRSLAQISDYGS